ncbi:hypothetical protein [Rhodococcus ruber]|uniref:hypothetical protein n=1 Tax=Rhodococcus ruber TaxID=1830 RepID=UPI00378360A8
MIKYPTASERDAELADLRAALHRVRAIANSLESNPFSARVRAHALANELHRAMDT